MPSGIPSLSPRSLLQAHGLEGVRYLYKWWRWRQNPYAFLVEGCWTKDEVAANPGSEETKEIVRRIPDKDYIRLVVQRWGEKDRLATPKSRRMLMTWIMTCLELRLCLYWPVTIHIYAQDQTSADAFVGRHRWVYDHLPPQLPKPRMREWGGQGGNPNRLLFAEVGSAIQAFPGTPDAVRGEGCTVARLEEFAFWKWPEKSWKAILPTVMGGGKLVVVSTPLANTPFRDLVYDEMGAI